MVRGVSDDILTRSLPSNTRSKTHCNISILLFMCPSMHQLCDGFSISVSIFLPLRLILLSRLMSYTLFTNTNLPVWRRSTCVTLRSFAGDAPMGPKVCCFRWNFSRQGSSRDLEATQTLHGSLVCHSNSFPDLCGIQIRIPQRICPKILIGILFRICSKFYRKFFRKFKFNFLSKSTRNEWWKRLYPGGGKGETETVSFLRIELGNAFEYSKLCRHLRR